MNTDSVLSRRLTEIRIERDIKRQKAADDLGISRASLEHYEKGKRKPNPETILKICNYYNVSADFLIGLSDISSRNTAGEIATVQMIHSKTGLSYEAINILMAGVSEEPLKIINSIIKLVGEK